jgi:general transcription factor 3C polypeptide 3 (transcription factor C subunit 4)
MDLREGHNVDHGIDTADAVDADHAGDATAPDAVSDADSDELELRLENAKFEREVQAFLDNHRASEDAPLRPKPRRGRPPQKGLFRSSRKEVEPRPDIKLRLTQVNGAFLRGDYAQAERMIHEIIRINAETYQAWTTLGTILEDQGRHLDALTAKLYASFLRDKDDAAWVSCAKLALELAGDDDGSPMLKTASMCFANAIKANSSNDEARAGRAEVNHRRGHLAKAVSQYSDILKRRANDISTIRKLADVCSATQNPEHISKATAAYESYMDALRHGDPAEHGNVLWADISIYVDLLICARDYEAALFQLKSLARWRLSREDERYWDDWTTDDREWDRDDDRRVQVPGFDPLLYLPRQYGLGLPLELRAQLGLCRIRLGHTEEFEVGICDEHRLIR